MRSQDFKAYGINIILSTLARLEVITDSECNSLNKAVIDILVHKKRKGVANHEQSN